MLEFTCRGIVLLGLLLFIVQVHVRPCDESVSVLRTVWLQVCVPLDPDQAMDFDPDTVPTVGGLLNELNTLQLSSEDRKVRRHGSIVWGLQNTSSAWQCVLPDVCIAIVLLRAQAIVLLRAQAWLSCPVIIHVAAARAFVRCSLVRWRIEVVKCGFAFGRASSGDTLHLGPSCSASSKGS